MEKPVIKITAYVDTVCPWCYIGKKHMERAIKEYSDHVTFEIVYETYWLNQPGDIPEGGIPIVEYLQTRMGITPRPDGPLNTAGRALGITFDWEKRKACTSLQSHKLLLLAKQQNKSLEFLEVIFYEHFCLGVDIEDKEVLLKMASKVGIKDAKEFLNDDNNNKIVRQLAKDSRKVVSGGVPFYVISANGKSTSLSGAASHNSFLSAFSKCSL